VLDRHVTIGVDVPVDHTVEPGDHLL
jgi:hypothetical protein